MRAYVLKHYGGPEGSQLMDIPAPAPGPRDILVEVRAAGLNPVDFKFRQGKLRAISRPKLPFVVGNELAGEVVAGPSRVTTGLKTGGALGRDVAEQKACAEQQHQPRRAELDATQEERATAVAGVT
jgi:NADPH:quinone reductase-like Zn-dependent oxidoreductase